jgi:ectoine hydroxylase-related dioxygenase (phytanoyl-CoA dioxygenase family)
MRRFSTLLQSSIVHRRLLSLQSADSLKNLIVSPEDIQAYKLNGVVCLRGVLSPAQCAELHQASVEFMKENKGFIRYAKDDKRFFSAAFMSKTVPIFEKFAKQSQLPSIAAQLMNNVKMVRFFYDQLFIKAAGTQARTAWHNDLSYWPFRGNDLISLWCALTPVKRESSGVEYVPGTHLNNTLYQAITTDEDENFIDPSRAACPDFSDDPSVVSWDMEAGDVLCHHPLTIHGSGANNSLSGQRIGLSLRYLGEDVHWHPSKYVMPIRQDTQRLVVGQYPADDNIFPPIYIRNNE